MSKVKQEGTFKRDLRLSQRHRAYGFDAPCTDLDAIEYDHGVPYLLVEDKHYNGGVPNFKSSQIRAQRWLADKAGLPFIVRIYWPKDFSCQIAPMNEEAEEWFERGEVLSEKEYVTRLYTMRGRSVPSYVLESLYTTTCTL